VIGSASTARKQCFIHAAEGRHKCGGMERAPFRWYEICPALLRKGSAET